MGLLTRDGQIMAPYHVALGKIKVARTRNHYVLSTTLLHIKGRYFLVEMATVEIGPFIILNDCFEEYWRAIAYPRVNI